MSVEGAYYTYEACFYKCTAQILIVLMHNPPCYRHSVQIYCMNEDQTALQRLIEKGSSEYSLALAQIVAEIGLDVERQSGQLILKTPIELLDRAKLGEALAGHQVDMEIHWTIDSTNTRLMAAASEPFSGYRVCLAEQQLAGRGRRGRTWVSPFGTSLYMSVSRKFAHNATDLGGLSLAVGIQVVKALRENGVPDAGLKWPNDVLLGSGKLAGILVEIGAPVKNQVHTVVGIGVNIQLGTDDQEKIDQPLSTLAGLSISRNALAGAILNSVISGMDRFADSGFSTFHDDWLLFDLYANREVVVHLGDQRITGVDSGVDQSGNLQLRTSAGLQAFNAGEVSLRPGAS
jgi:BirA family transcriptional regulator, biotin operon repressor / biotin---[acetyl-CoA-carboxylase] ligase